MAVPTPPGRKPGQSLPYHDLSPDDFERLCSDLLASQDDVGDADLNGLPRKHEHGVDVVGYRTDGKQTGLQAKRYKRIDNGKFLEWTREFLASIEYWRERGLDHFVLAFTVDTRNMKRKDELAECRRLCKEAGVGFETWHIRQIDRLLQRQPQIVHCFFGPHWEIEFCRTAVAPPVGADATMRVELYTRNLTEDVKRLVSAFECGDTSDVVSLIKRLKAAPDGDLSIQDRRTLLRIQFQLALWAGDRSGANDLRAEPTLREDPDIAVLYERSDPNGCSDVDLLTRHPEASPLLRGQLLLALGRAAEAATVLSRGNGPLEVAVRARAEAAQGDRVLALDLAGDALDEARGSVFVVGSSLAARFACCAAWGFDHDPGPFAPEPLPFGMMRRDAEAIAILEGMLRDIRRSPASSVPSDHFDRVGWEMAVLVSLPGRSREALELLCIDLDRSVPSAAAVHWALEAGLELDIGRAVLALGKCLRGPHARPDHLFVALSLLEAENRLDEAKRWLRRYGPQFAGLKGYAGPASWWKERLRKGTKPDALSAAIQRSVERGDWAPVTDIAKNQETGDVLALLRAAHAMAAFDRWDDLAPHLGRIERIGTPEAIRIAATAYAKRGRPDEVLRVLDEPVYPPGIPELKDITHLRAGALEVLGRPDEAIDLRRSLTEREPADDILLAASLLRTAKFGEAAEIFGRLDPNALPPGTRIEAASTIRAFRPDLARRLMQSIRSAEDVPEQYFGAAFELAARLGLDTQVKLMVEKMESDAVAGVVTITSVDEALDLMQRRRTAADEMWGRHLDGRLPLALLANGIGATVAGQIWGLRGAPILIRHASRLPRHLLLSLNDVQGSGLKAYPGALPSVLVLDYPALLLADRFGALDTILKRSERVLIPHAALAALGEDLTHLIPDDPPMPAHARDQLNALSKEVSPYATTVLLRILDEGDDLPGIAVDALVSDAAPDALIVRLGTPLLLSDSAVFNLLRRGVLETVTNAHPVYVTQGFAARCQRMFEQDGMMRSCCDALRELAKRIDVERQADRIGILPQSGGVERSNAPTCAILALQQIVTGAYQTGEVIVSGDRYLNGFGRIGTTPLLDFETLLSLLEDEQTLQPPDGRRIRFEMRKAGLQFLADPSPDAKDAIGSHAFGTAKAPSHERFAAIRRSMARAMQLAAHLRSDGNCGTDGQNLELLSYRDAVACALDVVRAAWTDDTFSTHQRWEVSNTAIDGLLHLRVPGNPAEAVEEHACRWMAQTYGMLLSTVFLVALSDEARTEEYLSWFRARCGYDLLDDPDLGTIVASVCENGLEALVRTFPKVPLAELDDAYRLAAARAAHACLALPDHFLRAFSADLLDQVGLWMPDGFEVGPYRISIDALAEAYRSTNEERTVLTQEGKRLPAKMKADGILSVTLDQEAYTCDDPEFALLAIPPTASPHEAVCTVPWLGTEAEAKEAQAVLRGGLSPSTLDVGARAVYGYGLERLSRVAHVERKLQKDLFHPPPPDILFRALGVEARDPVAGIERIPAVCTEADQAVLLRRRLHLPKRIPVEAISAGGMSDKAIRVAAQTAKGPIAQAMATLLFADLTSSPQPEPPVAAAFALTAGFARWSLRRFDRDPRWRDVSPAARLVAAWFHAGELCVAMGYGDGEPTDLAHSIALVDDWDPRSIAGEMGDRVLDRDLCGKDVRGCDIAISIALLHPEPDVLRRYFEKVNAAEMIGFLEVNLPDALGSILADGRHIASGRGDKEPYRMLDPERVRRDFERIDLSQARSSHIWNMILHTMRRGTDPETQSAVLAAWRDIDFPARCFRRSDWIVAGISMAKSFGHVLTFDDLHQLLAGCMEVERAGAEALHLQLCEELRASVAIAAARLDDQAWHSITDALISSLSATTSPRWRHTLANDLFATSLPRPDRAMCLLRKLRAAT